MRIPSEVQDIIAGKRSNLSITRSGTASQALVALHLLKNGRSPLILVPDQQTLQSVAALIELLDTEKHPFPEKRWAVFPSFAPGKTRVDDWGKRMAGLYSLVAGHGPRGLVATVDNLLPYWPARQVIEDGNLPIQKGEEVSPETLVEQAVAWGFERVSLVTRMGEFSLRGDVLDIYCPGYELPLRMEFFGDTLESLRLFEPLSQRSRQDLSEAVLLPVSPLISAESTRSAAKSYWEHLWKTGEIPKQALADLEQSYFESRELVLPGLFAAGRTTLDTWLRKDTVCMVLNAGEMRSRLEKAGEEWEEFIDADKSRRGYALPGKSLVRSATAARSTWIERPQILFEDIAPGGETDLLKMPEKQYRHFEDLFWKPDDRRRPWSTLVNALKEWKRTRRQTVVSFHSVHARRKFLKLLEGENLSFSQGYTLDTRGLFALLGEIESGYDLAWNDVIILSEDIIQPHAAEHKVRTNLEKFAGLKRYDDLLPDELLVHRDYGLARFGGLHHLQVDKTGNDYLLLYFAGEDKLYVPVDRLNLVQRYKGPEGATPALDRLGGTRWKTTTARVRKAVEKIAHDLVRMYAYRKLTKGYAYSPVDETFREFETSFGFEETPDQEQAIRDVLLAMERPEPMDILVCGDVGFGKTEVAMRAAFRAVLDGKQVGLLCPTTVLAEQHYQNFRQRMDEFSVNVAMLSRFVPRAEQKKILTSAAKGEIDILIGTHRILSDDVSMPRLSLLILDEEQRFGVKHKEKLKKLKKSIDALALTATPIPRTLQLSLSGIRTLSVMETPPPERRAVETSLVEKDQTMLKSVLVRELDRGGQVFWVHNRVQGLAQELDFVRSLVPDARVDMAHGQMKEQSLEKVMHQFWHGELDILVCTSIIESGLDFPRANTLIVNQAQRFGLGQLYQLRGRVGRSKRQAFAYFIVPSVERLTPKARKRMQTILEADYLGAGFQVAMEDLRLRGAGNILGEAQSGQIGRVGLDLFLEMLEQEVHKLKGEPAQEATEPELNIGFSANIPEHYIPDPQQRLRFYKSLSTAKTRQELGQLAEEMDDRFGPVPQVLESLLAVLELKRILARLRVIQANLFENRMVLTWAEDTKGVDPGALVEWVAATGDRAKMIPPSKLELRMNGKASISKRVRQVGKQLETLIRP